MNRTGKITRLLLLLSVVIASGERAYAQEAPQTEPNVAEVQMSLRPSTGSDGERFTAEVNAGESTTLTAVIASFGIDPIELRTYTSDVIPMVNGGIAVAKIDAEQHEPTTWMKYPTETMTLSQGQSVNKEFTITVPDGTPPGQYVNALILETVNPVEQEGGSAFEQYYRKVVSVYITVPGPVQPGVSLEGTPVVTVQGTTGLLDIPVRNSGNIRVDLVATITLKDAAGTVVLNTTRPLGPIYAGQTTLIREVVPVLPPEGDYLLSVTVVDEANAISESIVNVTVAVPAPESTEVVPIAFENVAITPNGEPIQFATVSVDVVVTQQAFRASRLTMSVFHNGEHVEDFVLAENLALSQGTTTVQQRYLPITGWQPGTYTFSLKLESTEGESATVLLTQDNIASIEVPS